MEGEAERQQGELAQPAELGYLGSGPTSPTGFPVDLSFACSQLAILEPERLQDASPTKPVDKRLEREESPGTQLQPPQPGALRETLGVGRLDTRAPQASGNGSAPLVSKRSASASTSASVNASASSTLAASATASASTAGSAMDVASAHKSASPASASSSALATGLASEVPAKEKAAEFTRASSQGKMNEATQPVVASSQSFPNLPGSLPSVAPASFLVNSGQKQGLGGSEKAWKPEHGLTQLKHSETTKVVDEIFEAVATQKVDAHAVEGPRWQEADTSGRTGLAATWQVGQVGSGMCCEVVERPTGLADPLQDSSSSSSQPVEAEECPEYDPTRSPVPEGVHGPRLLGHNPKLPAVKGPERTERRKSGFKKRLR